MRQHSRPQTTHRKVPMSTWTKCGCCDSNWSRQGRHMHRAFCTDDLPLISISNLSWQQSLRITVHTVNELDTHGSLVIHPLDSRPARLQVYQTIGHASAKTCASIFGRRRHHHFRTSLIALSISTCTSLSPTFLFLFSPRPFHHTRNP